MSLLSFQRFLRYAWASPATLVGLACATIAVAFGATLRTVDGTVECAGSGIARVARILPGSYRFVAITFGHVILGIDHRLLAEVRCHEHVHVRQYEKWGPLFVPLYLGSSLVQFVRGRDPYRHNCFEREAWAVEQLASRLHAEQNEPDRLA